ncbi:type II toxin-antitoxin system VapC family toxin [Nostoc sp. C052]|nr:type II toxin-antitoxin system VapC family toxin [Nostoc sp. C052]
MATTVYFFYCNVYDGLFGVALSRKLVLLTRNHQDLGKVPGLLIENWTV